MVDRAGGRAELAGLEQPPERHAQGCGIIVFNLNYRAFLQGIVVN